MVAILLKICLSAFSWKKVFRFWLNFVHISKESALVQLMAQCYASNALCHESEIPRRALFMGCTAYWLSCNLRMIWNNYHRIWIAMEIPLVKCTQLHNALRWINKQNVASVCFQTPCHLMHWCIKGADLSLMKCTPLFSRDSSTLRFSRPNCFNDVSVFCIVLIFCGCQVFYGTFVPKTKCAVTPYCIALVIVITSVLELNISWSTLL